jgi:acetylornithine/succinyldiaminopimelate/putrescine aminotransferase
VTWRSEPWYGFPRRPFDVTFVARGDAAAMAAAVGADVAAVIVEPVQGVAGAVDLPREFLAAARDATSRHGALLIFDEVQCGMGRSGQPFAADHYGIAPDLLTTAKGLAGGFPAGALLTTDALARDLKPGDLGTTFGGGPLACAAIETVIAVIRAEGLLARVRELSTLIRSRCRCGPVQDVQGLGFLLGLVCSRPAKAVQTELLECGILAGTSADPRVLRLLPPLTLEAAHVELLGDALAGLAP